MTYNNHSLRVLFAVCVRVHCAVLEEQPRCPSVSMLGWVAGWSRRVTAVIASRKRPVPFRTRKLSSIAPMVLHSGGCGRVGRRRTSFIGSGGVLEPRQGVRLHHSLLSCPKQDSPASGCAGGHRECGEPRPHRRGSPRIIRSARKGAGRGRSLTCAWQSSRHPRAYSDMSWLYSHLLSPSARRRHRRHRSSGDDSSWPGHGDDRTPTHDPARSPRRPLPPPCGQARPGLSRGRARHRGVAGVGDDVHTHARAVPTRP